MGSFSTDCFTISAFDSPAAKIITTEEESGKVRVELEEKEMKALKRYLEKMD